MWFENPWNAAIKVFVTLERKPHQCGMFSIRAYAAEPIVTSVPRYSFVGSVPRRSLRISNGGFQSRASFNVRFSR